MLFALIAVSTLLLVVLLAAVAVRFLDRGEFAGDDWFSAAVRKRVIVHQRTDRSIEGCLWEQTADGVLLRAAKLLGEQGQEDVPMAGEVFIPRESIAFVQLDE